MSWTLLRDDLEKLKKEGITEGIAPLEALRGNAYDGEVKFKDAVQAALKGLAPEALNKATEKLVAIVKERQKASKTAEPEMKYDGYAAAKILQEVPIQAMITSFGMGIAAAQAALDDASIAAALRLTKATVTMLGPSGENRTYTLMELGFAPTFYHFHDASITISVSLTMREDQSFTIGGGFGYQYGRGGADPGKMLSKTEDLMSKVELPESTTKKTATGDKGDK